jgi:hypothetical protein
LRIGAGTPPSPRPLITRQNDPFCRVSAALPNPAASRYVSAMKTDLETMTAMLDKAKIEYNRSADPHGVGA